MIHPPWMVIATPNTSPRRKPVALIVLHHTGGGLSSALNWLTAVQSRVSADFVVSRLGKVYKLNTHIHERFTWHAGRSAWKLWENVNAVSVGIELDHQVGEDWPALQVSVTAELCAWLMEEFSLDVNNKVIQSHRAVARPFGRKTDPEGFPWVEFGSRVRLILGGKDVT